MGQTGAASATLLSLFHELSMAANLSISALELKENFLQWKRDQLTARYGAYITTISKSLNVECQRFEKLHASQIARHETYWIDLRLRLKAETCEFSSFNLYGLPDNKLRISAHLALIEAAEELNLDFHALLETIFYYNQHELLYLDLDTLIDRAPVKWLAKKLIEDIKELDISLQSDCQQQKDITRMIIMATIDQYFIPSGQNSDEAPLIYKASRFMLQRRLMYLEGTTKITEDIRKRTRSIIKNKAKKSLRSRMSTQPSSPSTVKDVESSTVQDVELMIGSKDKAAEWNKRHNAALDELITANEQLDKMQHEYVDEWGIHGGVRCDRHEVLCVLRELRSLGD